MQSNRDFLTPALPPWLQSDGAGFSLALHVQPGARRDAIVGTHGGRLKVAVRAVPDAGRANVAVCTLLARLLAVAERDVTLAAGAAARHKRIVVAAPLTAARLAALAPPE
jgi:uncharacterized protein (TIGR00251 family)